MGKTVRSRLTRVFSLLAPARSRTCLGVSTTLIRTVGMINDIEPSAIRLLPDDFGGLPAHRERLPIGASACEVPLRAQEGNVSGLDHIRGFYHEAPLECKKALQGLSDGGTSRNNLPGLWHESGVRRIQGHRGLASSWSYRPAEHD